VQAGDAVGGQVAQESKVDRLSTSGDLPALGVFRDVLGGTVRAVHLDAAADVDRAGRLVDTPHRLDEHHVERDLGLVGNGHDSGREHRGSAFRSPPFERADRLVGWKSQAGHSSYLSAIGSLRCHLHRLPGSDRERIRQDSLAATAFVTDPRWRGTAMFPE